MFNALVVTDGGETNVGVHVGGDDMSDLDWLLLHVVSTSGNYLAHCFFCCPPFFPLALGNPCIATSVILATECDELYQLKNSLRHPTVSAQATV